VIYDTVLQPNAKTITMKSILLSLMLIPSFVFAQEKDSIVTYADVEQVDGATKDQLFQRARQWFNDAFKSSRDVLQINDKESGELAGKGLMNIPYKYPALGAKFNYDVDVFFKVNIWVKDGKYKYEFTSYDGRTKPYPNASAPFGILTSSPTCPVKWSMVRQKIMDQMWNEVKEKAGLNTKVLIAALKSAMAGNGSKADF
jgi:hypothetical protein